MKRNGHIFHGFTLIELLVVIAVIAILAAILFPTFARARAKGYQASCLSNLHQIGMALAMYQDDSDDKLMTGTYLPSLPPSTTTHYSGWAGLTNVYAHSPHLFHCPADPDQDKIIKGEDFNALSYFLNLNLCAENAPTGLPRSAFVAPALTVLVTETTGGVVNDLARIADPAETDSPFGNFFYGGAGEPYNRHFGGREFLLADGHVKWFRPEQVSIGLPSDAQNTNEPISISPDRLPPSLSATFAYQ